MYPPTFGNRKREYFKLQTIMAKKTIYFTYWLGVFQIFCAKMSNYENASLRESEIAKVEK